MPLIESLESRRLLTADLTLVINSVAIPSTLPVGVVYSKASAIVTVTNVGDAPIPAIGTSTSVTISLQNAAGDLFPIGTKSLPSTDYNSIQHLTVDGVIPATVKAGTYTVVCSLATAGGVVDENPENDFASGKLVTFSGASQTNLVLTAKTNLAGTVAADTSGKLTATISTNSAKSVTAKGTLRILSVVGDTSTVVATVKNIAINVAKGRPQVVKDVVYKLSNSTTATAACTVTATLTLSAVLAGDSNTDNTAKAATVRIAPSPLGAGSLGSALTFTKKSKSGAKGHTVEAGTFTDSDGISGKYEYRDVGGTNKANTLVLTVGGQAFVTGLFSAPVEVAGRTVLFSTSKSGSIGSVLALDTKLYYHFTK